MPKKAKKTRNHRHVDAEYMSPAAIAQKFKRRVNKIMEWIHSGELKAYNVASHLGGRPRWAIKATDFEDFLQRRSNQD